MITAHSAGRVPWWTLIGIVSLVSVGAYYFLQLSLIEPPQSDAANTLLYAWDILHGNIFLRGWTVAPNPTWLTDVPFYVAGLAIRRELDPAVLYYAPVATYLAVVALAAAAATAGLPAASLRPFALTVALLPLVFLTVPMIGLVLMGPFHTATTGAALAAALLLYFARHGASGSRTPRVAAAAGAFVALAAGELSDPFMAVLGIGPLCVVAAWETAGAPTASRRRACILPGVVAAGAWIAAHLGLLLITHFGGFASLPFERGVIALPALGESLSNLARALLDLSGVRFVDAPLGVNLVSAFVRLAYVAAALAAVYFFLRQPRIRSDWLGTVLSVAVALSLAAGAFGTYEVGYRYRVPPLILLSPVLARYITLTGAGWLARRRTLAGALLVLAAIAFAGNPAVLPGQIPPVNEAEFGPRVLGAWLTQHGLVSGYGEYWAASIVTVETKGKARVRAVRPVMTRGGPRVGRDYFMSKAGWYADSGANFLVLNPRGRGWDADKAVYAQVALATFGPPAKVYRVSNVGMYREYWVLVWDKDLGL